MFYPYIVYVMRKREARDNRYKAMENKTHQAHEQVAKTPEIKYGSVSADKAKTQLMAWAWKWVVSGWDVGALQRLVALNELGSKIVGKRKPGLPYI